MLIGESSTRFKMAAEYWTRIVEETQQKMQDRWEECLKNWVKIIQKMRDVHNLEFIMPIDFTFLNDIVKNFLELDDIFEANILELKNMER